MIKVTFQLQKHDIYTTYTIIIHTTALHPVERVMWCKEGMPGPVPRVGGVVVVRTALSDFCKKCDELITPTDPVTGWFLFILKQSLQIGQGVQH